MEEVTLTFKLCEGFTKEDLVNHLFGALINLNDEDQIIEEIDDGDTIHFNA